MVGFIIVSWGVFLGVSDPNAAIELGQNSLSTLNFLQASRQLYKDFILISSVSMGLTSPLAESNAVRQ